MDLNVNDLVVSEEHDLNKVDYGGSSAVDNEMNRWGGGRPGGSNGNGWWDEAEYGMSLAEAQRRWDAARTPEAREAVVADLKARALRRANLDSSTGRVALVVAGAPAWMKLGVNVKRALNSKELMELAPQLFYTVEKRQLELGGKPFAGAFGTLRTDTNAQFGPVGKNYKVYQNADLVALMDKLVGEKVAMFETCGALDGGKTFFVMARVPKEYRVSGTDDVMQPWTMLSNAHDGSAALRGMHTAHRVVCQNTLNMAVASAKKSSVFSVRHSKNMDEKVEDMRKHLGLVVKEFETFMDKTNTLAQFSMTETKVDSYFKSMFPTDVPVLLSKSQEFVTEVLKDQAERQAKRNQEVVDQLKGLFVNEKNSLKGMAGSAWAAVNAVTEYVDHVKKGRGKDDAARLEAQAFNSLLGTGADLKATAFNNAFSLSQAV